MAGSGRTGRGGKPPRVSELQRLREEVAEKEALEGLVHELKVHQEELRSQQDDLLEAQRALEESRDRYVDLFDFSPLSYLTLDANGVIREANLTAASLLGVERGRLLGWPFVVIVTEEDRRCFLDHMRRCRGADVAVKTELTLKVRPHGTLPIELVSRPVVEGKEPERRYHTALVDLSDRRQAAEQQRRTEEERLQKEAARTGSEAKDRFIAMLSHELRTPLTPILFALTRLQKQGRIPDSLAQTVGMIRRNVELEARMIDDLLDVTRISSAKLRLEREPVDLHEVVTEVVDMLGEELAGHGIETGIALAAPQHHVSADPTRMRQVLANLLTNSIRHTPRGGRITIATSNPTPDVMRMVVADTGSGIESAALPRIFDLFEQGGDQHRAGTGLGIGLAVCKGIVEAHGGRIAAASEGRGRGARFEVELAAVAPPKQRATSPRSAEREGVGRRILLVEDNADNAEAIASYLESCGYRTTVAGSVQQALGYAGEEFDLVISDIGLPDGDGYELMQRLKRVHRVPAIALSGYGAENDINRSRRAGFERHLTKPIDPETLVDAIEGLTAPIR